MRSNFSFLCVVDHCAGDHCAFDHCAFDHEFDDEVWTMRDYFWMVRSGIIEHSRDGWRSFRAGYTAMTAADPETQD